MDRCLSHLEEVVVLLTGRPYLNAQQTHLQHQAALKSKLRRPSATLSHIRTSKKELLDGTVLMIRRTRGSLGPALCLKTRTEEQQELAHKAKMDSAVACKLHDIDQVRRYPSQAFGISVSDRKAVFTVRSLLRCLPRRPVS
jgi:hypothetical protein